MRLDSLQRLKLPPRSATAVSQRKFHRKIALIAAHFVQNVIGTAVDFLDGVELETAVFWPGC
ncbi:MAG: hypothetical protein DHS20C20_13930 [Ardenticatenaceae bacterium]|nr:MAG: hypothetical protein DHS20C20_13930 [Ardenticatenaceae bacterium]